MPPLLRPSAVMTDLAAKRFQAVESGDVTTIMALLSPDATFDLYPIGLRLAGRNNIQRYYEHYCKHVAPKISVASLTTPLIGADEIAFEMTLHCASDGETYRMVAVMPCTSPDTFAGERLFADEQLFRTMFGGPTWDLLTPI